MQLQINMNIKKWVSAAFILFLLHTLSFGLLHNQLLQYWPMDTISLINRATLLATILLLIWGSGGWPLLALTKPGNKREVWILGPMFVLGGLTFISDKIDWQHSSLLSMIVLALIMALGEELLFRGYILSLLEKIGRLKALLITTFLFSATNVVGFMVPVIFGAVDYRMVFIQILFFAAIGLILGAARLTSNSLWMVVIANFVFKFSAFVASGGATEVWVYSESTMKALAVMSILLFVWGLFCGWLVSRTKPQTEALQELV